MKGTYESIHSSVGKAVGANPNSQENMLDSFFVDIDKIWVLVLLNKTGSGS